MAQTVQLDRQYIHRGKVYGPGPVEVDDQVAAELKASQERVQKQDAAYRQLRFGTPSPMQPAARTPDQMTYTRAVAPAKQEEKGGSGSGNSSGGGDDKGGDPQKELLKLKKEDLIERAKQAGVEVKPDDTKEVIAAALVAKAKA